MNTINNHGIELSVTVNGHKTRTYLHEGKYFIESRDGSEYAIEIKNTNWYNVEAVVAVDGLSVITGKPASKEDSGYIVGANDKIVIKGFRKDLSEVGAFKFTKKEKSYAASKGDASNVGVIAVAIYKEKARLPLIGAITTSEIWRTSTVGEPYWYGGNTSVTSGVFYRSNSTPTGAASGEIKAHGTLRGVGAERRINLDDKITASYSVQNVGFDHGTTWGQKITDKVVTTTFERERLLLTTEVFYNSKENLEAMGIKLVQEKQVSFPKGFPVDFAEPPSGWNG